MIIACKHISTFHLLRSVNWDTQLQRQGNTYRCLLQVAPENIVHAKYRKLYMEDFIEFGTSLRCPWLTEKGKAYVTKRLKEGKI